MTQLIIEGNYMPEINKNNYSSAPAQLGTQVEMVSGRMVTELRGTVQTISASYSYIPPELCRPIMSILRSGKPFRVTYLPDDSDDMRTGEFLVTGLTDPTFSFSAGGKAFWTGLAFTLREVAPHD